MKKCLFMYFFILLVQICCWYCCWFCWCCYIDVNIAANRCWKAGYRAEYGSSRLFGLCSSVCHEISVWACSAFCYGSYLFKGSSQLASAAKLSLCSGGNGCVDGGRRLSEKEGGSIRIWRFIRSLSWSPCQTLFSSAGARLKEGQYGSC